MDILLSIVVGDHRFWRYRIVRLGIFLCCLVLADVAVSEKKQRFFFVISKLAPAYTQVVTSLQSSLQRDDISYAFTTALQNSESVIDRAVEEAYIIVTLGSGATETLMRRKPKVPIIAALITKSAFSALATRHYGSVSGALASGVSAVYLDQPVKRMVALAKLLVPDAVSVGMLLGTASQVKADEYSTAITEMAMVPRMVFMKVGDNPVHTIDSVIKNSDVFIPVADDRLFGIGTAKWLLQLSYRYRVPVVAYSRAYLKAGALAAVYSSPKNVARQVAELMLDEQYQLQRPGVARMAKYFSVGFNRSVSERLGMRLKHRQYYEGRLALK